MKTYLITIERTERRAWTYEIKAGDQDKAEELAWLRHRYAGMAEGRLIEQDSWIDSVKEQP